MVIGRCCRGGGGAGGATAEIVTSTIYAGGWRVYATSLGGEGLPIPPNASARRPISLGDGAPTSLWWDMMVVDVDCGLELW